MSYNLGHPPPLNHLGKEKVTRKRRTTYYVFHCILHRPRSKLFWQFRSILAVKSYIFLTRPSIYIWPFLIKPHAPMRGEMVHIGE